MQGLVLLSGSVAGFAVYVAHLTVERKERSMLRILEELGDPRTGDSFTRDMRLIPRLGFILLTYTILAMIYSSIGV